MWEFIVNLNLNNYVLMSVVILIAIIMLVGGAFVLFGLVFIPSILVGRWSRSRGTIKILLDKNKEYSRGDQIEGRVFLNLKRSISSNNLVVILSAENTYFPKSLDINSEKIYESDESDIEEIYSQSIVISNEGEYHMGEYPFKIFIPSKDTNLVQECLNKNLCQIDIKDEVNRNVKTDWYLNAHLNTSTMLSIDDTIDIKVK
jgi:hypothetical protein